MENRTALGERRGPDSAAGKLVKKLARAEDQLKDAQHARLSAERQRQELQARVSTTEAALATAQQAIYKMERRAQAAYGRVDVEALERGSVARGGSAAAGGGGGGGVGGAADAMVEAKVSALQNLHAQKIKALMATINSLRLQVAKVKKESSKAGRSKLVQGQMRQLKQLELVVDFLKSAVVGEMFRSPTLRDDAEGRREAARKVNEDVIKKTLGGPKRFRPKSREELQNEVMAAERTASRARAREARGREGEAKREERHAEELAAARAEVAAAAAAAEPKGRSGGSGEGSGKKDDDDDEDDYDDDEDDEAALYGGGGSGGGGVGTAGNHKQAYNAPGSAASLLAEIEGLKVGVASRDLNLRAHMDELERLHEELRELKAQRTRFAAVDGKYRAAKADRARLEGELEELARERQLAEEEVTRHAREIKFLRAGTAADGAASAAGVREGEFDHAAQLRALQEKNLELEGVARDAARSRAETRARNEALERDCAELRAKHDAEAAGKHKSDGQNELLVVEGRRLRDELRTAVEEEARAREAAAAAKAEAAKARNDAALAVANAGPPAPGGRGGHGGSPSRGSSPQRMPRGGGNEAAGATAQLDVERRKNVQLQAALQRQQEETDVLHASLVQGDAAGDSARAQEAAAQIQRRLDDAARAEKAARREKADAEEASAAINAQMKQKARQGKEASDNFLKEMKQQTAKTTLLRMENRSLAAQVKALEAKLQAQGSRPKK